MCFGQKSVDLVAFRVVADRVGTLFRLHSLYTLDRSSIENVDCTRASAGYVEMFAVRIVEYYVRRSRQVRWMRRFPCMKVDCEQDSLITGAEEPSALHINIESMRTRGGNVITRRNSIRVQTVNRDYLWWFGNVDVESLRLLIEDCPSSSSGHENISSQNIFLHIN